MLYFVLIFWMFDNFCLLGELLNNLFSYKYCCHVGCFLLWHFADWLVEKILRILGQDVSIIGFLAVDFKIKELAFLCKFGTAR